MMKSQLAVISPFLHGVVVALGILHEIIVALGLLRGLLNNLLRLVWSRNPSRHPPQ